MRMLLLLTLVLLLQLTISSIAINITNNDNDFIDTLISKTGLKVLSGVTLAVCLPILVYVLDLLRYHAMLIRMETTTYRYMSGKKQKLSRVMSKIDRADETKDEE